jgi:hypothetical protein
MDEVTQRQQGVRTQSQNTQCNRILQYNIMNNCQTKNILNF